VLYELGLTAALEWVGERAAARYGLKVAVEVLTEDKPLRLPHETAVLLYQSVRELLTNVAKHAGARHAWVRLRQPDHRLHLTIEDDGVGFEGRYLSAGRAGGGSRGRAAGDTADKEDSNGQAAADAATAFPRDTGFGLFSIRTRLEYLGGSFRIEARPHGGARVTLVVPMASAADGFAEKEQAVSLRSNVDQTHTEAVTHHESTHRRRPPDRARRLA